MLFSLSSVSAACMYASIYILGVLFTYRLTAAQESLNLRKHPRRDGCTGSLKPLLQTTLFSFVYLYIGFQRALHASAVSHTELPVRFYSRPRDAIRPHSAAAQLRVYRYKVRLKTSVQMCASLMRRWDHGSETPLFYAVRTKSTTPENGM
jgi:hypothetical protein